MGALTSEGFATAVQSLNVLNEISMPVRIGWVVFFVWSLVQIEWYLRARTPAPLSASGRVVRTQVVTPKRPFARPAPRASESRSHYSVSRTGGSPEFLAALGLDTPERRHRARKGVGLKAELT